MSGFLSAIILLSFVIRHYNPRQFPCANATHCTSAFCSHTRCPPSVRSPSGHPVPPAVTPKTQRLFFEGILERKGKLFNGEISAHAESNKLRRTAARTVHTACQRAVHYSSCSWLLHKSKENCYFACCFIRVWNLVSKVKKLHRVHVF